MTAACFFGFHRWRHIHHKDRRLGITCTRGRHAPRGIKEAMLALAEAGWKPSEEVEWGWEGQASAFTEEAGKGGFQLSGQDRAYDTEAEALAAWENAGVERTGDDDEYVPRWPGWKCGKCGYVNGSLNPTCMGQPDCLTPRPAKVADGGGRSAA